MKKERTLILSWMMVLLLAGCGGMQGQQADVQSMQPKEQVFAQNTEPQMDAIKDEKIAMGIFPRKKPHKAI